jgi:hypothetical protein
LNLTSPEVGEISSGPSSVNTSSYVNVVSMLCSIHDVAAAAPSQVK